MIAFAVFFYSAETPFPGVAAVLPCGGAALLIVSGSGHRTLAAKALSLKPATFVGLISYSLYLWHWPIIVFQNSAGFLFAGLTSAMTKAALFAVSFVPAILSWRFVELPFRAGPLRPDAPRLFWGAGLTAAAICGAGAAGLFARGFPQRFSPAEIQAAAYLDYVSGPDYRRETCFLLKEDKLSPICLAAQPGKRNVLLIGDSLAADLWAGLSTLPGLNVMQATMAGCPPLADYAGTTQRCARFMHDIFQDVARLKPSTVLISASWKPEEMPALEATLDLLRRDVPDIVLFGPHVRFDTPLPLLAVAALRAGDPALPGRHVAATAIHSLDETLARIAREKNVRYVSIHHILCGDGPCPYADAEGRLLTFDEVHFTKYGSLFFAAKAREALGLDPPP